ncbi:hypothetical protein BBJ29_004281 [Phytophthora kernoviae]|uniref:Uncharacterized protein n=1 Tax=Phytophthora kernoviae TaxID=325452 RepID=A0A3F2RSK1_9STRA|nr:hypothetical protein BBJ29_004281 [Phytophthora kernoviae]RLN63445.1 hypothetical protein BBP00_00004159 [Phytophthora kernoviae]
MQHLHSSHQSSASAPLCSVGALDDDLLAALDDVLSFGDSSQSIADAFATTGEGVMNMGDGDFDIVNDTLGDELDAMVSIEIPTLTIKEELPTECTVLQSAPASGFERKEAPTAPMKSGKDIRATPYNMPAKPRRRKRPKHELDYLRAKVAEMEKELATLNKKPGVESPSAVSTAIIYDGVSGATADGKGGLFLQWKKIAERQKEEVNRSVMENLKLRSTLEGQVKVARALEAAIDQQQREAAQSFSWQSSGGGSGQQRPTTMSDELIYAILNDSLAAQYMEVDAVMELSGLADVNHDLMNGAKVFHDSNGISFRHEIARVLPFSMRAVHRAMWSILRYGTAKDMMLGPFQTHVVDKNHLNVTMVEKLQLGNSRSASIARRFAMRRFFQKDRIVMVWTAFVEIDGSVFVRLREKGYATASAFNFGHDTDASSPGVAGSVTRMAIFMTPELAPFASEQQEKEHIGEMTELVIATHQLSMGLMYQIVDTLLLRETMGGTMPGGEEEEEEEAPSAARLVGALILFLVLEIWWRPGSTHFNELENIHELEFYPDEIIQDKTLELPESERMHLAMLHEGCMKHRESVITWEFGQTADTGSSLGRFEENDPNLRQKLEKCPDVEVFLPSGIRGDGYCEDAMGYVKYLQGRALPRWVLDVEFKDDKTGKMLEYHDLCPKTPLIFMNHFWDGVPDDPSWPDTKPVYLMPNVEMYELEAEHYWRVDAVLCKTAICARRVRMWYQQEGNPRHTRVWYTRHTTSDAALYAKHKLGASAEAQGQNFSNVRFVHTAGKSVFKGTNAVLDCWLNRPDFPPLDVFVDQDIYNNFMKKTYGEQIRAQAPSKQITLHTGRVPGYMFGRMMIETAFLLCTSVLEGYGHYINQARANSALIVTTDSPPMNELLSPQSAVLVPHPSTVVEKQLLGGNFDGEHGLHGVQGMATYVKGAEICDAVERILEMTPAERQSLGERARKHL